VCSLSTDNISLTKANFVWISSIDKKTIFTDPVAPSVQGVYSYSSILDASVLTKYINQNVIKFSRIE
jgi:hypothetical protein